jgi:methylmalonyl-CoA/ethylmalonyl-CoA epimerase
MLGRLNHVAIAVADLESASAVYRSRLGAQVSEPRALPEHGVSVVFVDVPNTRIELIAPLGEHSPVAKFVAAHPRGAVHHLCFEVDDILAARQGVTDAGGRVLGSGCPTQGAHGKPVLFLDPRDCAGVLIELEEA